MTGNGSAKTISRNARQVKSRKIKRKRKLVAKKPKILKKKKKLQSTFQKWTSPNIPADLRRAAKTVPSSTPGRTSTRRARTPNRGKGTSRPQERVSHIKNNFTFN